MRRWGFLCALVGCTPTTEPDAPVPVEPTICDTLGLTAVPFQPGGEGRRRRELAPDFTIPDQNGDWTLSSAWTGCDTYVFVSDGYRREDGAPLWTDDDLDRLLRRSPPNVHWFFVSQEDAKSDVDASLGLISAQLDKVLRKLDPGDAPGQADWWADRVHLVQKSAQRLGFVGDAVMNFGGGSSLGFAIDRTQRLRGIGSLSDNERRGSNEDWPYVDNFSFYANEPEFYNYEVQRDARLTALTNPEVVTLWEGEVLAEYADTTALLPSAEKMATFDTLLIDLSAFCPDPDKGEAGNCGAWDYIGNVFVQDGDRWLELARFITPYHREQAYVLDASALLPLLAGGGQRTFRYSFAPSWNTQPTETVFRLWFSNEGKGARPVSVTPLFTGGAFGPDYNAAHPPITAPVSASATKVGIFSLITGHGAAYQNCAEFCDHQHEYSVGGHTELLSFPEVADNQGCMAKIDRGVVPNQWGTWWFGRGGWCPGMAVDPWEVDITAWAPAGQDVEIGYRGLLDGAPPTEGSGDISMTSWLVVYE